MDTILNITMIQIDSTSSPFTFRRVGFQAITVLGRADAMGILPQEERIDALDFPTFRTVFRYIQRAGIGKTIRFEMEDDPDEMEQALKNLNTALEESPSPEFEWNRMLDVLGPDLLSGLLGISASSIRRYSAAARTTPDETAVRLHFLCLMVGDLSGAYNEMGVRQWFQRTRAQLAGRAPADLLSGAWKPEQKGPRQVQDLARALAASPAT